MTTKLKNWQKSAKGPRPIRVLIAIPTLEYWHYRFGRSLAHLILNFIGNPCLGRTDHSAQIHTKHSSILPNLRNDLCKKARDGGFTHVLFLDTDMEFPPQTLTQLLEWEKSVVACNCPIKTVPSSPTARQFAPENTKGRIFYTMPGDKGLVKIWRIGTAVMLINTEVFKLAPPPWFALKWREDTEDFQGEDWTFCEFLEEHGVPIYIDQELSWDICHVGSLSYHHGLIPEVVDGTGNSN